MSGKDTTQQEPEIMSDTSKTRRMPKCPWPSQVIRDQAARMRGKVGGAVGWAAIGPVFRAAMVDQAVVDLFATAAIPGPITVSNDDIHATRRAIRFACGITD